MKLIRTEGSLWSKEPVQIYFIKKVKSLSSFRKREIERGREKGRERECVY